MAFKTGSTDQSHFTNFFKKFIGLTPKQYMNIFSNIGGRNKMTNSKIKAAHMSAVITIIIWGATFISTKVLLKDFAPIEILVFRFMIGYITLLLIYPHHVKTLNLKQELYFVAAGICGVTLYFLLENIALTYTLATNVGVIISSAPFFTAVILHESINRISIIGIALTLLGLFISDGKQIITLRRKIMTREQEYLKYRKC